MSRRKADIAVYTAGCFRMVAFLMILFTIMLISLIYRYIINRNAAGPALFLLIAFMALFGGAAVLDCSRLGDVLKLYGDTFVLRKWYGAKRTFGIADISGVIFEKRGGEIISVRLISDNVDEKLWSSFENFDKLRGYLTENIAGDRIFIEDHGEKTA